MAPRGCLPRCRPRGSVRPRGRARRPPPPPPPPARGPGFPSVARHRTREDACGSDRPAGAGTADRRRSSPRAPRRRRTAAGRRRRRRRGGPRAARKAPRPGPRPAAPPLLPAAGGGSEEPPPPKAPSRAPPRPPRFRPVARRAPTAPLAPRAPRGPPALAASEPPRPLARARGEDGEASEAPTGEARRRWRAAGRRATEDEKEGRARGAPRGGGPAGEPGRPQPAGRRGGEGRGLGANSEPRRGRGEPGADGVRRRRPPGLPRARAGTRAPAGRPHPALRRGTDRRRTGAEGRAGLRGGERAQLPTFGRPAATRDSQVRPSSRRSARAVADPAGADPRTSLNHPIDLGFPGAARRVMGITPPDRQSASFMPHRRPALLAAGTHGRHPEPGRHRHLACSQGHLKGSRGRAAVTKPGTPTGKGDRPARTPASAAPLGRPRRSAGPPGALSHASRKASSIVARGTAPRPLSLSLPTPRRTARAARGRRRRRPARGILSPRLSRPGRRRVPPDARLRTTRASGPAGPTAASAERCHRLGGVGRGRPPLAPAAPPACENATDRTAGPPAFARLAAVGFPRKGRGTATGRKTKRSPKKARAPLTRRASHGRPGFGAGPAPLAPLSLPTGSRLGGRRPLPGRLRALSFSLFFPGALSVLRLKAARRKKKKNKGPGGRPHFARNPAPGRQTSAEPSPPAARSAGQARPHGPPGRRGSGAGRRGGRGEAPPPRPPTAIVRLSPGLRATLSGSRSAGAAAGHTLAGWRRRLRPAGRVPGLGPRKGGRTKEARRAQGSAASPDNGQSRHRAPPATDRAQARPHAHRQSPARRRHRCRRQPRTGRRHPGPDHLRGSREAAGQKKPTRAPPFQPRPPTARNNARRHRTTGAGLGPAHGKDETTPPRRPRTPPPSPGALGEPAAATGSGWTLLGPRGPPSAVPVPQLPWLRFRARLSSSFPVIGPAPGSRPSAPRLSRRPSCRSWGWPARGTRRRPRSAADAEEKGPSEPALLDNPCPYRVDLVARSRDAGGAQAGVCGRGGRIGRSRNRQRGEPTLSATPARAREVDGTAFVPHRPAAPGGAEARPLPAAPGGHQVYPAAGRRRRRRPGPRAPRRGNPSRPPPPPPFGTGAPPTPRPAYRRRVPHDHAVRDGGEAAPRPSAPPLPTTSGAPHRARPGGRAAGYREPTEAPAALRYRYV
ncbi:collagen alpha-1(I) chain-like [Manacus candei]|uniref:collagen alpha-1(I) chain-like n=1 Tax=Manacus candei TaxID=415023 RepID=UPI002227B420|nr:collagen alpha-1(I) chain-like [Manacus candei]XP_051631501.1 collagen alpha-1(I) chain-like [Manacus candei]XP_051631504.1 collagen alpha-1(I) chain-like [Manacus candei]XP_051631506.1 collagen alpha-1(I) chain-like [Manacus candei]XP_051631507.1 collagen alpha-1(I) chain-like [Manacus candei]XP_051631508.1 collagen alpha-1(I) chain-like [Manacus candei]XP_051631509.1 collagen alpha-1(I) chain-like [Manacus candei]XP_051631510.1 collagen alpha-1(I) chain-like [Manacus candei]XP_05163151